MYENIFKRVEQKYLLTEKEYKLLFKKINKYLIKDKYFKSTICNIYFDTVNNDLIINSLEKPVFKEKIRLRSYQVPSINDDVFLEIKEKYMGVVGKRRVKIKLKDFYDYLETNNYDKSNQIMNEINYYFKYYGLKPAIYIAYDRVSYCSNDDKGLRITVVSNLRSRNNSLKLELGDTGKYYFQDKNYIMEIKTLGWLVRNLSELKIYPTSFSKYGSIYQSELKERNDYVYI